VRAPLLWIAGRPGSLGGSPRGSVRRSYRSFEAGDAELDGGPQILPASELDGGPRTRTRKATPAPRSISSFWMPPPGADQPSPIASELILED